VKVRRKGVDERYERRGGTPCESAEVCGLDTSNVMELRASCVSVTFRLLNWV